MNKKSIIHVSITFIVVLILILTGPASAVKIVASTPSGQYYSDETVTFTVNILFRTHDLIPIDRIDITGLPKGDLSFRPDGTIISGDAGYNVIRTSSAYYGYGYGYGYDQNPGYGYGYGYDFGYGYGYGYGYVQPGYGYGYVQPGYGYDYEYGYDYGYEKGGWKSKLSYEIEVSGLAPGMYSDTINIYVLTGNAKKPSFASSKDYSFEIIPRPTEEPTEGIVLKEGWNFISVPGVLNNPTPEYVLSGLEIDAAYHYDAQNKSWEGISEFVPGTAYFIKVSYPQTIVNLEYIPAVPPSLQLYEGQNAIGLIGTVPGTEMTYAEINLAEIDEHYCKIRGPWDPELKGFVRTGYNRNVYGEIPCGETTSNVYTENFPMKRYEGYWICMTSSAVLNS